MTKVYSDDMAACHPTVAWYAGGGDGGGRVRWGGGGGGAGDFFKIKRKNQNGTCFFSPKLSVGIPIK